MSSAHDVLEYVTDGTDLVAAWRNLIGVAAPEHRDWLGFEAARARLL